MNTRLLKRALAAILVLAANGASAQSTTTEIINSQSPSAGFLAPKPAEPRDLSMAKYARESFLAGEEGVVGLHVLVRQNGSVGDSQVALSSGSSRLDEAAQTVVKDWRYQPATVNGAPVDAWVPVNIVWALQTLRFDILPEQARKLEFFYPPESYIYREAGISTVRFFVTTNGTVTKAVIDNPSGYDRLDKASIQMVKTGWRFSPAILTTGERLGAWFRVGIAWTFPGSKFKDGRPCGSSPAATDPDAVILDCTQLLTTPDLTSYQRAQAYESRGRAHAIKREIDQSIADYDAGIRASPGLSNLYINRATSLMSKGKKDEAFSDFDSAVQVEPLNANSYLVRAQAYFYSGEQDRAIADFGKAIQVASADERPDAYNTRCYFLVRLGKPQDGLADCDKSLSLRPRNAFAFDSRAYAYFKLGQYQRAIQDYDAAIRIDARLAPSLYGRGVAKLKLGDAKGEADLNAAKAVNPMVAEQMATIGVTP